MIERVNVTSRISGKDMTLQTIQHDSLKANDERIQQNPHVPIEPTCLLFFAGSTYAMIKVTSAEGWARLTSKRIEDELEKVSHGKFDFAALRHLLMPELDQDDT